MVPVKSKVKSAKQLKGATVCVQSGTTTEKNLTDFSRANKLDLKPIVFEKQEAATGAYFSGRCVAFTTDASGLASIRNKEAKNPKEHIILPELISKEPLGPAVRRGDDEWFAIAKWVVFGLIEAEEYGITQANVDQMKTSSRPGGHAHPRQRRRTPASCSASTRTGWSARIKAIGNYGEIFERNVGPKTSLGLPRGVNNLWNKGGIDVRPAGPLVSERLPDLALDPTDGGTSAAAAAAPARLVLAQPGVSRARLPGPRRVAVDRLRRSGTSRATRSRTCRRGASRAASISSLQPAGFDIGESIIPYDALDPYWKAFLVGILNTLRVAIIGIVARHGAGHAARHRALLAQRHRARPVLRLRGALPQHPGAAAAADVVPVLHRDAAADRRAASDSAARSS